MTLKNGYKLITFEKMEDTYKGLGLIISKQIVDKLKIYKEISDRVAYIELQVQHNKSNIRYRMINIYKHTSINAKKNPIEVEKFYNDMSQTMNIGEKNEIVVCGDFNSRHGKDVNEEMEMNRIRGEYGHGRQNDAGMRMECFMVENFLLPVIQPSLMLPGI